MAFIPYAHTRSGSFEDWEPLAIHLDAVAQNAESFADAFRAGQWGSYIGILHDLGKYSAAFQDYLRRSGDADASEKDADDSNDEAAAANADKSVAPPGKIDHSTFGAQHAHHLIRDPCAADIIAFCIAGHHSGLTDYMPFGDSRGSALNQRLAKSVPPVILPSDFSPPPVPGAPSIRLNAPTLGFQLAFFTRMLFSCLIDADRLATEEFCNPSVAAERLRKPVRIQRLADQLKRHLAQKQSDAATTPVNATRRRILADCLAAAPKRRGFLSLNVPTGGGKTLASLAFALHHILHHQENSAQDRPLRRVVMAIPFTSIIEQTAGVHGRLVKSFGVAA